MPTSTDPPVRSPWAKRAFDLAVGGLVAVLALPLLLVIALLVRAAIGSPVIFRQERPGMGGRPFTLLKFRTMNEATDGSGRLLPDEVRLGRFGKWLRASSLDELPEIFNVLAGDMSLVGPRPLLMEYLPLYTAEQMRRHEVRPGITGWAQVNGRNAISWSQKFAFDVWYVDHWSFRLDLRILWMTFVRVLRREGISQEGQATVEKFRGDRA